MPLLPIDKVVPGMRTASPIHDAGGALLVREAAEITADLIAHLRNRKITVIDVVPQGMPVPAGAGSPQGGADAGAQAAALAHAFERVMGHEVMKALYDSAAAHLGTRGGRTA
ncbi:MAG: hypothetical protein HYY18_13885 [Planctomycetes bacterium]|nr:hypothetical protein [Planctomycetota bacterium]